MQHKAFKSWLRKRYPAHELRRVNSLFAQDSDATEEEREAYIAEQTEQIRREWQPWELHNRIVQAAQDVEVFIWKKS